MKHRSKHPDYVEDCLPCKWSTIGLSSAQFTRERKGRGPLGDGGTREYVNHMFEQRRLDDRSDPIPASENDNKFAPAIGVKGGRKYREANAGL